MSNLDTCLLVLINIGIVVGRGGFQFNIKITVRWQIINSWTFDVAFLRDCWFCPLTLEVFLSSYSRGYVKKMEHRVLCRGHFSGIWVLWLKHNTRILNCCICLAFVNRHWMICILQPFGLKCRDLLGVCHCQLCKLCFFWLFCPLSSCYLSPSCIFFFLWKWKLHIKG